MGMDGTHAIQQTRRGGETYLSNSGRACEARRDDGGAERLHGSFTRELIFRLELRVFVFGYTGGLPVVCATSRGFWFIFWRDLVRFLAPGAAGRRGGRGGGEGVAFQLVS